MSGPPPATTSGLPIHIPAATFPSLVGVLGSVALLGGTFNFVNPLEGARGFGLIPAESRQPSLSAFETAYIRVHGIRNVGVGLGNLGLLLYWGFSDACRRSPVAEQIVRRCLGIGLVTGTVVGMGDAWILKRYYEDIKSGTVQGDSGKESKEAKELALGKSKAHAITAVGILAVGLGLLLG